MRLKTPAISKVLFAYLLVNLFLLSSFSTMSACEVLIMEDETALAKHCAKEIILLIESNARQEKNTILGLATGSTPILMYEELVKLTYERQVDWSRIITFNLDEYVGLSEDHPQSYRSFMEHHLFRQLTYPHYPLGIDPANIHFLNGKLPLDTSLSEAKENEILQQRAADYEALLDQLGPIDIQILGIGTNGHIGFAEPGSSFSSTTMLMHLSLNTIYDNARFFENPNDVPKRALTMGIKSILKAKKILLLATGVHKAEIIVKTLLTPANEAIPATALHAHPNVSIYLDSNAATKLLKKG